MFPLCAEQGFQRNYSVSSVIAGFQVGIQTFQLGYWILVRTADCQVVFMVSGWLKEIFVGIQGFQYDCRFFFSRITRFPLGKQYFLLASRVSGST
jgi:hypothetical protein